MKNIDSELIDMVFESFVENNRSIVKTNEYSLTESAIQENEKYGLHTYNESGNFNIDEDEYKNFLINIM
jgi:hypothetical protein